MSPLVLISKLKDFLTLMRTEGCLLRIYVSCFGVLLTKQDTNARNNETILKEGQWCMRFHGGGIAKQYSFKWVG